MKQENEAYIASVAKLARIRKLIDDARPGSFNPGWWHELKKEITLVLNHPVKKDE